MSSIGGLYLPKFETFDYGRAMNQGINAAGGMLSNETRLLELAELKRQQEAQAQARAYYQQNPSALLEGQPMPQSTLGSLAPAGRPAAPSRSRPFARASPPRRRRCPPPCSPWRTWEACQEVLPRARSARWVPSPSRTRSWTSPAPTPMRPLP